MHKIANNWRNFLDQHLNLIEKITSTLILLYIIITIVIAPFVGFHDSRILKNINGDTKYLATVVSILGLITIMMGIREYLAEKQHHLIENTKRIYKQFKHLKKEMRKLESRKGEELNVDKLNNIFKELEMISYEILNGTIFEPEFSKLISIDICQFIIRFKEPYLNLTHNHGYQSINYMLSKRKKM